MEVSSRKNDISKVIRFWKSFFPEMKDEEIENTVKVFLGVSLEEAANLREDSKQYIDDKYFLNNLEDTILAKFEYELQKNVQWVFFFEPIIKSYFKETYTWVSNKNCIKDTNIFLKSVLTNLYQKLVNMSYRVIVMETNIASEDGKLFGENGVERATYYCTKLLRNRKYLEEIYNIYPELVRLLDNRVRTYFHYIKEIIDNIGKYLEENDTKILEIEIGQGDTHNDGRSVAKLILENKTLYYKPRTLCMENKYEELQLWLEKHNKKYRKMKRCKSLDYGTFGLMEKVENNECSDICEVQEFYYKMGQLLCLLYTLNSKDFHCENIVADGDSPILIDLETLLHSTLGEEIDEDNIIFDVHREIQDSVIGTSILPTLLPNLNTEEVIEVGGMGKGNKQYSPFKTQVLKKLDSDDIRIEFINKELPFASNYPKFNGEIVGCIEYLTEVRKGFSDLYLWIESNKSLYKDKINELFFDTKCRVILKNTNIYSQLLETGNHPDLLHNEWDRKIYFCRLGIILNKGGNSKLSLYLDEYKELLKGDVPIYSITVDGNSIYNASYCKILELADEYTVLDKINKKIENMNRCDYQRQIALINHSFIGSKIKTDLCVGTEVRFSQKVNYEKCSDKQYICTKEIADLCEKRGVRNKRDEIMWIGMRGFGKDFYRITPVGLSLYQGNCGIGIFFYLLYKKTGENRYKEVMKNILAPVIKTLDKKVYEDMEGIGAFTGYMSYVYTLLYLYTHGLSEEIGYQRIDRIIKNSISNMKSLISSEGNMDLLAGISGILGVYLSAFKIAKDKTKDNVLDFVIYMVDILLKNAIRETNDWITWNKNSDIGYAHGNAGIISQLARYYKITQEDKVKKIIDLALNYERQKHFDNQRQKWIFRENVHYFSWCNGIGGLLLEKVILSQCGWEDTIIQGEIVTLIEQLKSTGFGTDTSICHGDMGSLQILTYVSEYMENKKLYNQCLNTKKEFINWFLKTKIKDYQYLEDWGLMTGITGIGMAMISDKNELIDLLSLT